MRGGTAVLRGLSFAVPRGARLGIFGPGGCGKTTLLKLLAGLYRPSRGSLRWQPPPGRGELGMVFQRDALLDSLTTLRNAELPLLNRILRPAASARRPAEPSSSRILRPSASACRPAERSSSMPAARAEAVAREALARVGLDAVAAAKTPAQLSGGMRKRAGIARVLAANPPLKLYDEPAAGLDPATEREILELMDRAHAPAGLTVAASASPRALWARCDLALILDRGEAVAFGEAGAVSRRPDVRALLGIEPRGDA